MDRARRAEGQAGRLTHPRRSRARSASRSGPSRAVWNHSACSGRDAQGGRVTTHEPDRRDLFEAQAAPLYDEIVADGGIKADDPRIAEESPQRDGFDLLVELGLVQFDQPERDLAARGPHQRAVAGGHPAQPGGCPAPRGVVAGGPSPSARSPMPGAGRRSPSPAARSPTSTAARRSTPTWPRWSPRPRRRCSPPSRRPAAAPRPWPRPPSATPRCSSAAPRCARSTSTAPGAARSRTSTSRRSPPAAPRCARSTSSSTG